MARGESEELVAGASPSLGALEGGHARKTSRGRYQTAWRVVPACAGYRIGLEYSLPFMDHAQARREYLDFGKQQVTR